MTNPSGDQPELGGLHVEGLRLLNRRPFLTREMIAPPRSQSPPPENLRSPPDSRSIVPVPVPSPTPSTRPNPWSVPHRPTQQPSRIPRAAGKESNVRRLKPYDPSYTWNRGGRVKELRIRFIARKFLRLWIRRAFGRVLPSTARVFYHRHLLRSAWCQWYQLFWDERKEWRLRLRAECHDRLRLWNAAFSAWKTFTLKQRVKRARLDKALTHFHMHLRVRVWITWREFTVRRGRQRRVVLAFRAEWLMRRTFTRWRGALAERRTHLALEEKADRNCSLWTKRRFWRRWCEAMNFRAIEREKENQVQSFYSALLKRRALSIWSDYVGKRRHKRIMKARAERFLSLTLKERYLSFWTERRRRMVEIRAFEGHIQDLARRSRLRWTLCALKRNVQLVRDGQVKLATAVLHDEFRVKRKAYDRLISFLNHRRKIRVMKEAARLQYKRMLLVRSFRQWTKRFDFVLECRLKPQTRVAHQLRRLHLKRFAFRAWRRFVLQRRRAAAHTELAEQHFARRRLPQVFDRWKLFVSQRRVQHSRQQLADTYRRQHLLAAALQCWRLRLEQVAQERFQHRVAVLHERETLLTKYFAVWWDRTEMIVWEREKEAEAVEFDRQCLLRLCLTKWRQRWIEASSAAAAESLARRHLREALLKRVLRAWRSWAHRRALKRHKWNRGVTHGDLAAKRKAFQGWRLLLLRAKAAREAAERLAAAKNAEVMARVWPLFRKASRIARERRLASEEAQGHFRRALLTKVLSAWRICAANRASHRAATQRQVQAARLELSQGLARRVLAVWSQRRDQRVLERLAMTRARLHHEAVLLRRMWAVWRDHVSASQGQRLRQRQAEWFDRVRLLGGAVRVWKERFEERQHQRLAMVRAVVHWAVSVQRRTFTAWRLFVCTRRLQKERENAALMRYRDRLLRDGVCLWLRSVDRMKQERQAVWARSNRKEADKGWTAARRCALRWRQKIAERKERKPPVVGSRRAPKTILKACGPITSSIRPPSPTPVGDEGPCRSRVRPSPRVPEFLRESLQRANLLSSPPPELEPSSSPPSSVLPTPWEHVEPEEEEDLLPPSHFAVEPGQELENVCQQLRKFRAEKRHLKALRSRMKTGIAAGDDVQQLKAEIAAVRAVLAKEDPNVLLIRAKALLQAVSTSPRPL